MSLENPWTHIKIRARTRARLLATAARIVDLVEQGRVPDPGVDLDVKDPRCCGLSLDALINLLLDEREAHTARAKKSRAGKRAARDHEGGTPAEKET